jgi:exosome complex component RRP4
LLKVGDIIVGRIAEVCSKRWKVDIQGYQDAVLHLSSVNLPGGEQRKRNYEDQLQMRTFFSEGDLVSAEVQSVSSDGAVALHTRSLKYGKLENGQFVRVPTHLIKKVKQHSLTLECGVDIIIGNNGYIWIARSRHVDLGAQAEAEELELDAEIHANTPTPYDMRLKICRVRNVIVALASISALISPDAIVAMYRRSEDMGMHPKELIEPSAVLRLLTSAMGAEHEV